MISKAKVNQINDPLDNVLGSNGCLSRDLINDKTDINFNLTNYYYSDISWYQAVMGKLIYMATHLRPDICFVFSRLCAFMHCPTDGHVVIVRRILRYLKQTINYRLCFRQHARNINLYCDADFSKDIVSSKSVTGVAGFVFGNLVNWFSRKQKLVSNSTCQAEVMAIVDATLEAEYIYKLLNDITELTYNFIQS